VFQRVHTFSGTIANNVPTIDAASWVADVGIGSVWLTKQRLGEKDDTAPQNLKLSRNTLSGGAPTKEELDNFYKASAPEPDILGDVDGFGLFDKMNSSLNNDKPLSKILEEYYLSYPEGQLQYSVKARWQTFANGFQVKSIEGTFKVNDLTEAEKIAWISRIDTFNNLFGDSAIKAVAPPLRNLNWKWQYTKDMFERFIAYTKD
jgi:hypothetical protein